tara:strand:- start:193 stop:972 length:780 start_codon:yes stop_codon:yes gene_type:complete
MSTKKRCKTIFVLKIEDIESIDKKYSFSFSNDNLEENTHVQNKTEINDLTSLKTSKYFSYMDESKKIHNCNICMLNHLNSNLLESKTNINCFWCRHKFSTIPLGCPTKYISPQFIKQYYSEITKDKYIIKENIIKNKLSQCQDTKSKQDILNYNDYYETDGVFCSFNCCLAFINENYKNILYRESKLLLSKIYNELFESEFNIKPSPSWRLLKDYGGHLTIDEFRNDLYKVTYEDTGNIIKNVPKQLPIGHIFEQKIKF